VRHCAKFHVDRSNRAEILRFFNFLNGGRPPSSICYVHAWTTHDEYLVVFIIVQNLIGTDGVSSIIYKC